MFFSGNECQPVYLVLCSDCMEACKGTWTSFCEICSQVFITEQYHYTVFVETLRKLGINKNFVNIMGGSQGKEIPKQTPLGCALAHWWDMAGEPGGTLSKKTLIKYCNQWWLVYKLEDDEKWHQNGTLKCHTFLQLL